MVIPPFASAKTDSLLVPLGRTDRIYSAVFYQLSPQRLTVAA